MIIHFMISVNSNPIHKRIHHIINQRLKTNQITNYYYYDYNELNNKSNQMISQIDNTFIIKWLNIISILIWYIPIILNIFKSETNTILILLYWLLLISSWIILIFFIIKLFEIIQNILYIYRPIHPPEIIINKYFMMMNPIILKTWKLKIIINAKAISNHSMMNIQMRSTIL